jgi:hypothetical protein
MSDLLHLLHLRLISVLDNYAPHYSINHHYSPVRLTEYKGFIISLSLSTVSYKDEPIISGALFANHLLIKVKGESAYENESSS